MSKRPWYIMAFLLFCLSRLVGQTQVEVVTRTISDEFDFYPYQSLEVSASSALITIRSWDQPKVKVVIKLISKGLNKEEAEKELNYQRYLIDREDNNHMVRTYLLIPQDLKELKTIQETVIELLIPRTTDLTIANSFGVTDIAEVSGILKIENQYGELLLDEMSGSLDLSSSFGTLNLSHFSGSFVAELEQTKSQIQSFSGNVDVKTTLGDMDWQGLSSQNYIKIKSIKSNVQMVGLRAKDYNWRLRSKYGAVQFSGQSTGINNKLILENGKNLPEIEITSDYGLIRIEE